MKVTLRGVTEAKRSVDQTNAALEQSRGLLKTTLDQETRAEQEINRQLAQNYVTRVLRLLSRT